MVFLVCRIAVFFILCSRVSTYGRFANIKDIQGPFPDNGSRFYRDLHRQPSRNSLRAQWQNFPSSSRAPVILQTYHLIVFIANYIYDFSNLICHISLFVMSE